MKILIVDDSRANQILLSRLLQKDSGHDVLISASAAQAYEMLGLNGGDWVNTGVDLILMDIVMPGVDGIEACRVIKAVAALRDVPVIMVTAKADGASLQAAFEAGAMDYITKPINPVELLVRVRSALALKTEIDRRKAREKEISQIGASIQQTLLAGTAPQTVKGMTVAARAIASQLIDGDFYDFFQHGEALLDVVVADVMGKGVPAALLGAATKANLMRAMTLLASACTMASPGDLPDPQTIVGAVHHQMTEELIRLGAFVTLCCARIDASRLQLQLVDAGHAKTIHYHKDSDTCSLIEGRNMPLGFDVGENYRHVGRFLAPGDVLLFYSDGITEARNTDGHPYGEQRLMQYLPAAAHLPPDQLITAVVQDVTDFGGTTIPTDDLTCVAVKIDDQPPAFSPRVITVDGRLEAMPTLRAFIHRFCRDVNAGDEGFAFCLQLAVHELAVNIIRHSRQGPRAAPIQVQAMAYPRRAGVHLFYPGSFYQPRQDVVLPPERFPESGYGLFIVNQCVSGVVYSRRRDGTNCIGLYKNITEGHGKGDPCT